MPFPVVVATNESSTNTAGTSHVVSLPTPPGGSYALHVGKLIVVVLDKGTPATTATFDALAGWTELVDENTASGMYAAWHKVDGTEGSTITLTSSGSIRSAEVTYLISGAADPDVIPPTISTVATGTSANPESSSVTVPASSGQSDFLVISACGMVGEEADDDTWVNSGPTGYSNVLQKACGVAGTNLGGLIMSAHQTVNRTTEDPASFNVDVSAAWRGFTIAVAGALAPTPGPTKEDRFRILGPGGLRKSVEYSAQADPPAAPTTETPTPGGATAGGASPVAVVTEVAQGATGGGTAPSPQVGVTSQGAVGAGAGAAAQALAASGGGPASGFDVLPQAPVAAGGATGAGEQTTSALAGVTIQGAVAGGVAPTVPAPPGEVAQRNLTEHFLVLGPGGLRKLRLKPTADQAIPVVETPTPGGATAGGVAPGENIHQDSYPQRYKPFAPLVFGPGSFRMPVRQQGVPAAPENQPTPGGAVAGGVGASATAAAGAGGVSGSGQGVTAATSLTIGGGSGSGTTGVAVVSVTPGGATAGGVAPTDGSPVVETPVPGGGVAGGTAPTGIATVTIAGALGGGSGPGGSGTAGNGGALGQGNTPNTTAAFVIAGATATGLGATARVTFGPGSAVAGGNAPGEPTLIAITGHFDAPTPGGASDPGTPAAGMFDAASPGYG